MTSPDTGTRSLENSGSFVSMRIDPLIGPGFNDPRFSVIVTCQRSPSGPRSAADVESVDIGRHLDVESARSLAVHHQGLGELLEQGRVGVNGVEWNAPKVHRIGKCVDALTHERICGNPDRPVWTGWRCSR